MTHVSFQSPGPSVHTLAHDLHVLPPLPQSPETEALRAHISAGIIVGLLEGEVSCWIIEMHLTIGWLTSTRFSSSLVFSSTCESTWALIVFGKEQVLLHLLFVSTPLVQNSWKVDPSQVSSWTKSSFHFFSSRNLGRDLNQTRPQLCSPFFTLFTDLVFKSHLKAFSVMSMLLSKHANEERDNRARGKMSKMVIPVCLKMMSSPRWVCLW